MYFKKNEILSNKIFFVIILLSIAFINSETMMRPILVILSSFCILIYIIKKRGNILIINKQTIIIIFLTILSFISLIISGNIANSIVNFSLFFYSSLCSLVLYDISRKEPDKYFYVFFASHVILNVFIILIFKDYAIYSYEGKTVLRGLYYEKNGFSSTLLIGIPSFIYTYKNSRDKKSLLFLFLSFLMIYFSKSTTAMFFSLFLTILTFSTSNFQKYIVKKIPLIVVSFYYLYLNLRNILFESAFSTWFYLKFHKRLNLSGRDVIWDYSLRMFKKKPLFGYGYRGLWSDKDYVDSSSYALGYSLGGGHAHSGYIELLLSVGIFGSFILIKLMYDHYRRTINIKVETEKQKLFRVYFIFILIYAIISNSLMSSGILWSMLIIIMLDSFLEHKSMSKI